MSARELPDFLKRGDADLGAPRARYPGMQIGKGTMRAERVSEPLSGDAMSAREWAVRDWLAMVDKVGGSKVVDHRIKSLQRNP